MGSHGDDARRPASRPRSSRQTRRPRSSPRTAARSSPGSDEIGLVAAGGYGAARLLQGPREVGAHVPDGRRRALLVPRATWRRSRPTARSPSSAAASKCINTGGEKVFPEEVEEAVKRAPGGRGLRSSSACPTRSSGSASVAVASLVQGGIAAEGDVIATAQGDDSTAYKRAEAGHHRRAACPALRTARPTTRPRSSSPSTPPA